MTLLIFADNNESIEINAKHTAPGGAAMRLRASILRWAVYLIAASAIAHAAWAADPPIAPAPPPANPSPPIPEPSSQPTPSGNNQRLAPSSGTAGNSSAQDLQNILKQYALEREQIGGIIRAGVIWGNNELEQGSANVSPAMIGEMGGSQGYRSKLQPPPKLGMIMSGSFAYSLPTPNNTTAPFPPTTVSRTTVTFSTPAFTLGNTTVPNTTFTGSNSPNTANLSQLPLTPGPGYTEGFAASPPFFNLESCEKQRDTNLEQRNAQPSLCVVYQQRIERAHQVPSAVGRPVLCDSAFSISVFDDAGAYIDQHPQSKRRHHWPAADFRR